MMNFVINMNIINEIFEHNWLFFKKINYKFKTLKIN